MQTPLALLPVKRALVISKKLPFCRADEDNLALLQSGLFSAACLHCWEDLEDKTQEGILDAIRLGCQEAVVLQEEAVEELGRLTMEAAPVDGLSKESLNPTEAINVLILMSMESGLFSNEAALHYEVNLFSQQEAAA